MKCSLCGQDNVSIKCYFCGKEDIYAKMNYCNNNSTANKYFCKGCYSWVKGAIMQIKRKMSI